MSSSPSGVVTHMPSYVAWENVRALPLIRLVTLVSLMGMISYYHVARMWKYYKIKRTLTIHIAVGLVELFKFSFEDIFRNPIPGVFDFAITLYQSKNALAIIASLRKGDRKWSRPIFHAAVLLRIALSGYSVLAKSTSAYRVSIALDHGFIWDRLMLWGFMRVLPKYSTSYLLAQYLGALVSFETNSVEGGFLPLGGISLVFTVMMVAFRLFDEWNIIDMSMFEEKPQVTTETSTAASVEASVTAAPEQTDMVEVSADVSQGAIEPQVEIIQEAGYFAAPRLQLDTHVLDQLKDDLATPTLDSATSSYSDGSMSPVSSMGSPLLTPATPTVFHAPAVDHFSATSQEEKLRKIQMLNGGDFAFPQPPTRTALPAFEEAVLKPMPGGDAEMWQASKQDFAATVNTLGQAFCKLAAQSGFTSLDHYETLKKRKFTVNNLEA